MKEYPSSANTGNPQSIILDFVSSSSKPDLGSQGKDSLYFKAGREFIADVLKGPHICNNFRKGILDYIQTNAHLEIEVSLKVLSLKGDV